MLISHRHKFITVDIPKTGTRTLREILSILGVVDFHGYPETGIDGQIFTHHNKAKDSKIHFQKLYNGLTSWSDYKKFSIIRNPWKRYLSYYTYRRENAIAYRDTPIEDKKLWPIRRINQGRGCLDWLSSVSSDFEGLYETIQMMDSQDSFIYDESGELLIDYIANTETINEDIQRFLNSIGIEYKGGLVHANKSTYYKSYLEYYNQEIIDLVTEKESKIIDLMNLEIPKK